MPRPVGAPPVPLPPARTSHTAPPQTTPPPARGPHALPASTFPRNPGASLVKSKMSLATLAPSAQTAAGTANEQLRDLVAKLRDADVRRGSAIPKLLAN